MSESSPSRKRPFEHDDPISSQSSPSKRATPSTSQASTPAPAPARIAKPPPQPPSADLNAWLSIPPPPPLPVPYATSEPIIDRDSIFIAYAFSLPLSSSSSGGAEGGPTNKQGAAISKTTIDSLIARLPHDHPQLPDVIAGRSSRANASTNVSASQSNADIGVPVSARKKIKPSHNMWAYRNLVLSRGKSGTSEHDYETLSASYDDDEKYGGEHILRSLKEEGSTDTLVVCSRWFGGTMIGPARFKHIEECTKEALRRLEEKEECLGLWSELEELEELIDGYREELEPGRAQGKGQRQNMRSITDPVKLRRLIKAKSMTVKVLLEKVGEKAAHE